MSPTYLELWLEQRRADLRKRKPFERRPTISPATVERVRVQCAKDAKAAQEKADRENPIRPELHPAAERWYAIREALHRGGLLPLLRAMLEAERDAIGARFQAAANREIEGVRVPMCNPDSGWYLGIRSEVTS